MRLNVHKHGLFPDGVFTCDSVRSRAQFTGVFAWVDSPSFGSGLYASGFASWDGTRWSDTGLGLYRATFGGDAVGVCSTVHDGRLVVGGDFDHAGPLRDYTSNVVSHNVIAWNGSSFDVLGEGKGLGDGRTGLLRWNDSLWSIENDHYAGAAVSPRIARFDGVRWHTVGPFDPRTDIEDAVVFQNELHVVGDLRFESGLRLSGVVRYDGTQWTSLGGPTGGMFAVYGGQLYVGTLGGVQRLVNGMWSSIGSVFGQVTAMEPYAGRLYIGGRFNSGTEYLLAWDGTRLTNVAGLDGGVGTLHVHNNELWIGGSFQTPSAGLARYDGTSLLPFGGPTLANPVIRAMETLQGRLYISGTLGVINGTRTTLASWDDAGLVALGAGPNVPASTLLADEDTGELWIGGGFFLCDGLTAAGLTVWREKTPWEDLGHALSRTNGVTPHLEGFGDLRQNNTIAVHGAGFVPNQLAALFAGTSRRDLSLLGGTLVPNPTITLVLLTDSQGGVRFTLPIQSAVPSGLQLFVQYWSVDGVTGEASATNAAVGR